MHDVKLSRVDINLLVVFHHVAECRSVTAAADRLALSQPAVSHAVGRLRRLFGDPLFVREKGGLGLTMRALDLVEPVRRALDAVELVLAPQSFDPATTTRRFRIGASEYTAVTLLPAVACTLHIEAPHAAFAFEPINASVFEQLAKGEIEVAFWGTTPPPKPFVSLELFRETQVGVVGVGHPLAAKARLDDVSLVEYMSSPHWRVNYAASIPTLVDTTLNAMGLSRRIALETSSFGGDTALLQGMSLVLTLPLRVFGGLPRDGIHLFSLPFEVPDLIYYLVWHPRTEADLGSKWLRSRIIDAVEYGH